ncbi:MAG: hypothetical protein Kow0073_18120 [Immundisolibacter sp.]
MAARETPCNGSPSAASSVPLDFSDPAHSALDYAAGLGQTFDAELMLTYVAEPPPFAPDPSESRGYEQKVAARAGGNGGIAQRMRVRVAAHAQRVAAAAHLVDTQLVDLDGLETGCDVGPAPAGVPAAAQSSKSGGRPRL